MVKKLISFLYLCFTFNLIASFANLAAAERTWYPVTAGSFTNFRPSPIDEVIVSYDAQGIFSHYVLRSRSSPVEKTTFILLDLGEAKIIKEIQFQNTLTRATTQNIGYIEIHIAENEDDPNFDPFSRDSFPKSLYKGVICPVLNLGGLLRRVKFPFIKRRYFLIEVFSTNRYIEVADSPEHKVGSVNFADILINEVK